MKDWVIRPQRTRPLSNMGLMCPKGVMGGISFATFAEEQRLNLQRKTKNSRDGTRAGFDRGVRAEVISGFEDRWKVFGNLNPREILANMVNKIAGIDDALAGDTNDTAKVEIDDNPNSREIERGVLNNRAFISNSPVLVYL